MTADTGLLASLLETARVLAQNEGTVVRKPVAAPFFEQVVRQSELQGYMALVRHILGAPLDVKPTQRWQRLRWWAHPVRRQIGRIHADQSLFAAHSNAGWIYLWIMPWSSGEHATLRFGVVRPTAAALEHMRSMGEALHREYQQRADAHAQQLQGAVKSQHQRVVRFDAVSHYYVTPTYAGPDRRKRATSPLSRFLLFGRRAKNVTGLAKVNYYADRLQPRYMRYLYLLVALSAVDAFTTLFLVFGRSFVEVNPLMRGSLSLSPLVFLGVKLAVTLVFCVLILIHQHFRALPWILRTTVALYAYIDVRALWLIITTPQQ